MHILVLDLSANVDAFEFDLSRSVRDAIVQLGSTAQLFQLQSTDQLADGSFLKQVNAVEFDFSVVIAHGNSETEPATIVLGEEDVASLNNAYSIHSLFPHVARHHKLLLVCEGLTPDAGAALNTSLPEDSVPVGTALVASTDDVCEVEALQFVRAFFSEFGRSRDIAAAVLEGRKAADDSGCTPRWYWIPSGAVKDVR